MVNSNPSFRFTLFYGNPRVDGRKYSWDLLRSLQETSNIHWMIFGDFNEILYTNEMEGNRPRNTTTQMRLFRNDLTDCRLIDIGSKNGRFTFSNRRKGIYETKARLDRVIVNKKWRNLLPRAKVNHGLANTSDHILIIISMFKNSQRRLPANQHHFRFEPMWLIDTTVKDKMEETWRAIRTGTTSLSGKLQSCANIL